MFGHPCGSHETLVETLCANIEIRVQALVETLVGTLVEALCGSIEIRVETFVETLVGILVETRGEAPRSVWKPLW